MECDYLECDYLVVGAGASGMAFIDELITTTLNETIIVVDKHSKPGGHWNDAYDFVTLHQPAQYYGVPSKQLGKGTNKLSSFNEIRAYYEDVMEHLIQTGRVTFYFQCEYKGDNSFKSMLECNLEYSVQVRKKTVDATYVGPSVPSTRKPEFEIEDGVHLKPINSLSHINASWQRYVVIGGGKTGIDAVLYLLDNYVNPERITWIIPNDYWLINRTFTFTENLLVTIRVIIDSIIESESCKELIQKWENIGYIMRIDEKVEPKAFKAGTVSEEEMKKLRLIKNIVREGRVLRIEISRIVFKTGNEIETYQDTFHCTLFCTGNGATPFTPKPIFNGKNITLQNVRLFQSVYSASCIAAFEQMFPDDEMRKNNALCPLTHPQNIVNYIKSLCQNTENDVATGKELGWRWSRGNHLDMMHHLPWYRFVQVIFYAARAFPKMMKSLNNISF